MPTIAIDARELRTSTGRYIEKLIHYLQKIDTENNYVVLLKPKDVAGWQSSNPKFVAVACPHKEFTFDEQLGFKKQLDEIGADLVHFGMVQQPVLYSGKVVTTIHDLTTVRFLNPDKNPYVLKAKQQVYKQVIKRAARKSLAVITPSEFVKKDLVDFTGIKPEIVTVTYESADPITETPEIVRGLEGSKYIMYIGRPTPHKNLERLIEAFVVLQKDNPSLKLVLAGKKDANYQRIEQGVVSRDIENVVFTDFVSEGQLRWLYENCQAYVFPSLSEGFGLPGLEAMIHGAPVVSSNATCLPEVYGDAAHYFDPLDVNAMVKAIGEVLTDSSLRETLIAHGHKQVTKYSWQRMAEQTLAIYNSIN